MQCIASWFLVHDWGSSSADRAVLSLTSKFDEAAIGKLLNEDHELAVKIGFNDTSNEFLSARQKLQAIVRDSNNDGNGVLSIDIDFVVDGKGQRQGQGRFYGDVPGYTGLNRVLRGIVGGTKYYWYMDMSNAHPSILLGLSKLYGVELPCLRDYVENRDDRIEEIQNTFSCSRKIAKHLVLIILFGGNADTWVRHNEMHVNSTRAPEFIINIQHKYEDWQNLVFDRVDELSRPDLKIS